LPSEGARLAGLENLFSRSPKSELPSASWPVAVTFDDGPDPVYTTEILEILAESGVRATFFVVGQEAQLYPSIIEKMHNEGHQVENHSFTHRSLLGLAGAQVQQEVIRTSEVVEAIIGMPTRFFRPPLGAFDDATLQALDATGHDLVLWNNVGGSDLGIASPHEFVAATVSRTFPGAILMFHASRDTVNVLPDLISALLMAGYDLVTLDDMLTAMSQAKQAD